MITRRVALQGLVVGAGSLSIATQGFQPLRVSSVSGGGGRAYRVPRELIDAQRRRLIDADEILLLIAGSVAAGIIH
jgi:hypothetical protein